MTGAWFTNWDPASLPDPAVLRRPSPEVRGPVSSPFPGCPPSVLCALRGRYTPASMAHRPGWLRVDRLLGKHGLQEDGAAARQEFERRVEAQRLEPGDEESN